MPAVAQQPTRSKPQTRPLSIRLEVELLAELHSAADRVGTSVAELLRRGARLQLDRVEERLQGDRL
jgi:Ribbon-helix-helix protein, copG family